MFKADRNIMLTSRSSIKKVSYKIKHTWPKLKSGLIIIMAYTCLVCQLSLSMELSKTSQDLESEAIDMEAFWDYTQDDSGQTRYKNIVDMFLDELPAYQALWPKLPEEVRLPMLRKVLRDNDLFNWLVKDYLLPCSQVQYYGGRSTGEGPMDVTYARLTAGLFSSSADLVALEIENEKPQVFDMSRGCFHSCGKDTCFPVDHLAVSFDHNFHPIHWVIDEQGRFTHEKTVRLENKAHYRVLNHTYGENPTLENIIFTSEDQPMYLKLNLRNYFDQELIETEMDRHKTKLLAYDSHKICVWFLDDRSIRVSLPEPVFQYLSEEGISFAQFNTNGDKLIVAFNEESQIQLLDIASRKSVQFVQISQLYGIHNFWFHENNELAIGLLYAKTRQRPIHDRFANRFDKRAGGDHELVVWDISQGMTRLHVTPLRNNGYGFRNGGYGLASPTGSKILVDTEFGYAQIFDLRELYEIIHFVKHQILLEHAILLYRIKQAALKSEKFNFHGHGAHYENYYKTMPSSLQKVLSKSVIVPKYLLNTKS